MYLRGRAHGGLEPQRDPAAEAAPPGRERKRTGGDGNEENNVERGAGGSQFNIG